MSESETVITETWVKPLSMNDELMIEVLTHRYEGVEAPFVRFEDETSVTLRIPKIIRPTFMKPFMRPES